MIINEKLLYVQGNIAGEDINLLVDSGASHNFAPVRLIQAMHLPVVKTNQAEVTLPNGAKLISELMCKVCVKLRPGVVDIVRFVVVDVALPFVLGMQFLRSNNAHVDFATNRIQLRNTNGQVTTELITKTAANDCTLQSATVKAAEAFGKLKEMHITSNVFACSAKQANKMLRHKNNESYIAFVRQTSPNDEDGLALMLQPAEVQSARLFVEQQGADCDEFAENTVNAQSHWNPTAKLNQVRNVLFVNNDAAREAKSRMYQRTDFYVHTATETADQHQITRRPKNQLQRAQILACNHMKIQTLQQLEGLITLPKTLFLYNVWVVPAEMKRLIRVRLESASNCIGNVVVSNTVAVEQYLAEPLKELLTNGSPKEHILELSYGGKGLPKGSAKHLLAIQDRKVRQQVRDLLCEFAEICPPSLPAELPPVRGIDDEHRINLQPDAKPVCLPPYRQGPAQQDLIRREIEHLLSSGCIRPSSSPYASPVLLIRKPDGSLRFCIDYRQLNKITVQDKFPIPRTDDLIEQLAGSKIFSSLDLRSGYWQIKMHEESVSKTAFVTAQGQWEWLVLPMGLTNAPSSFQRIMTTALGDLVHKCVKVYLDDIIIHSPDIATHMLDLHQVLERLQKYHFYIKLRKCKFLQERVTFLGHDIDKDGIHISRDKVLVVQQWPPPKTVSDVRSFLGFIQFFRRSLQNLAQVSLPLTNLTRKDVAWKWTQREESAFLKLKDMILHAPCLALVDLADVSIPLEVHTDASNNALAGVLLAKIDQDWRPVAYHSRKFGTAESNYSTTERELLAVVDSLRHFRYCLLGREFRVCTDHKPLVYFFGKSVPLSPRQARWQMQLCEFQPGLKLIYLPGKQNVLADGLSRRPDYAEAQEIPLALEQSNVLSSVDELVADCFESALRGRPIAAVTCQACKIALPPDSLVSPGRPVRQRQLVCRSCGARTRFSGFNTPLGRYSPTVRTIDGATGLFLTVKGQPPDRCTHSVDVTGNPKLSALGMSTPTMDLAVEFQPLQEADPALDSMRQAAKSSDPHFRLRDGLLYRVGPSGDRVVVPTSLVEQMIGEYHDHIGHLGVQRTLHRLGQRYWFPSMQKKVTDYVRQCDTCQRTKVDHTTTKGQLQPIPMTAIPWRDIAMDFLTEVPTCKGVSTLLVVVDRFSKMLHLVPLEHGTEAPAVATAFFQSVVRVHGLPSTIISDRDPRFQSEFWKCLLTQHMGTDLKFSTAFHPQTDGQSERSIRSILQMLRAFVHEHPTDWMQYLAQVELYYNATKQQSTGKSPHQIVFGREVQLPGDLATPSVNPLVQSFVDIWAKAKGTIERSQNAQKQQADKKRSSVTYSIDDYVLLNTRNLPLRMTGSRKLQPIWIGPYRVSQVVNANAYKLDLPSSFKRVHNVFNVSQLKLYRGSVIPPPDPIDVEGLEEFEVSGIVSHRRAGRRKRLEYLVSFTGYDQSANEWLPESHLANASRILREYKLAHGL